MLKRLFLASVVSGFSLLAGAVHAAPADDARGHFQAIAAGDVDAVMRAYAEGAQLQWVGGPLDGSYSGGDAIRGVWAKFAGSQGPLKLQVGAIEESANPKGSTVSANVLFEGKARVPVRYILTFRDGRIVSEIWQIDPKLSVAQTN